MLVVDLIWQNIITCSPSLWFQALRFAMEELDVGAGTNCKTEKVTFYDVSTVIDEASNATMEKIEKLGEYCHSNKKRFKTIVSFTNVMHVVFTSGSRVSSIQGKFSFKAEPYCKLHLKPLNVKC